MIDVSSVLSNTTITIQKQSTVKDVRGGSQKGYSTTAINIKTKIESQEVDVPVTISGRSYRHWYLIHIWADEEVFPEIHDNYRIKDEGNSKMYQILEVQPGSLYKDKPYKYECKAIVLKDIRFNEAKEHI